MKEVNIINWWRELPETETDRLVIKYYPNWERPSKELYANQVQFIYHNEFNPIPIQADLLNNITQGEWKIQFGRDIIIYNHEGVDTGEFRNEICVIPEICITGNISREVAEANSRIISAAPEMLIALYRISALYGSLLEEKCRINREESADWKDAQAAIRKAIIITRK